MRNLALVIAIASSLQVEAQDPEGPQPESEPEAREAAGSEASDADETAEDPENTEEETFDPGPSAIALARALDARLTVWQAGERRVYVRHCRNARVDCRARVVALSRLISESAHRHQVDPFLVAAMALRESGLNPFAEGSVGERGIVQLHPRGVGSRVRFVRSEGYRRRCERRPDACQAEVIEAGASHVASAMERCGSVPEALGAYNTGVCQETGYSRRVLEERENLLRLAKARVSARAAQLVD